jgi:hypothetical protein
MTDQTQVPQPEIVKEPQVEETPKLKLMPAAKEAADLQARHQDIARDLSKLRAEQLKAIQTNSELVARQNRIEELENLESEAKNDYDQAIVRLKQAGLDNWIPGQSKTFLEGLLTVKELKERVIEFDKDKALSYLQTAKPEHLLVLAQPKKAGFQSLAKMLDIPSDVIEIGTTYSVAIKEGELMNYITLDVNEPSEATD